MFARLRVPRAPRSRLRAGQRYRNHRWLSACTLHVEALEDRRLLSAVALGDEFAVGTAERFVDTPLTAHDALGNFVVVWEAVSAFPGDRGIYAQRYDASGAPQGDLIVVTPERREPAVAMNDGGEFVVTWQASVGDIVARRFKSDGTPEGDAFGVNSHASLQQRSPVVAMDAEGGFVVTWWRRGSDLFDPQGGVFGQRFNSDGTPLGDAFLVGGQAASRRSSDLSVAMNDEGEFAVALTRQFDFEVTVQQYHADGTPRGSAIFPFGDLEPSFDVPIEVSIGDRGDLIVAVHTNQSITAQRFNANGIPQGEIVNVVAPTLDFGLSQDSAGNFLLAWTEVDGIRTQRYSAAGVPLESEIRVTESDRDLLGGAFLDDQGQFAVAWRRRDSNFPVRQVFARQYVGTSPLTVANVSNSAGDDLLGDKMARSPLDQLVVQFSGAVSTAGGSSGAHSVTNPANWQLLKDAIDISSQIVGIDYAGGVATINLADTLRTAEYEIVASDAIQDPDGAPLDGDGDEVPGGDFSTSFRAGPLFSQGDRVVVAREVEQLNLGGSRDGSGLVDVATSAAGDHVVVWGGQADLRIYAQRYDAIGQPLGDAIVVDQVEGSFDPEAGVHNPSVAIDGRGNFIVSWTFVERSLRVGTKVRRYTAAGTPLGDAVEVTDLGQFALKASVAADFHGNFVVLETGLRTAFRRFNSDGVPQGDWITIENAFQFNQFGDVAMNSAGEYVISWNLGGTLHARAFSPLGIPRGNAVLVAPENTAVFSGLAIDEQGNFVVGWRGDESLARQFDALGVPLGDAVSVSPRTGETYSVTIGPDGAFQVAWASRDAQAVYVQRLSASGERVGSELAVSGPLGASSQPFVASAVASAIDSAGDVFVAWRGEAILPDRSWGTAPFLQRLVTDHAPLVDLNGAAAGIDFATDHLRRGGPVPVADANRLFVDSSFAGHVDSATVAIDGFREGDVLAFDTAGTSIAGNYSGGVLSLSGSDSAAHYQQVLRSVTFDTTARRPAIATVDVSFVVDDGTLSSLAAISTISNFLPGSASNRRPAFLPPVRFGERPGGRGQKLFATDMAAYLPGSGPAPLAAPAQGTPMPFRAKLDPASNAQPLAVVAAVFGGDHDAVRWIDDDPSASEEFEDDDWLAGQPLADALSDGPG